MNFGNGKLLLIAWQFGFLCALQAFLLRTIISFFTSVFHFHMRFWFTRIVRYSLCLSLSPRYRWQERCQSPYKRQIRTFQLNDNYQKSWICTTCVCACVCMLNEWKTRNRKLLKVSNLNKQTDTLNIRDSLEPLVSKYTLNAMHVRLLWARFYVHSK